MLTRRTALAATVLSVMLLSVPAIAAETVPYTNAAFDAAQKAGRPTLIEIQAPWCPTCKAQAPILSEIEKQPQYAQLLVLHVDFDSQKDAVKRFGAKMQSTLITFKDGKETGRSVGDTKADSIAALVAKAI
ncbi:MAG: thioredoxin family protein [Afipia sp.]|nr:thioredoxin family protein [Afipia sp.]